MTQAPTGLARVVIGSFLNAIYNRDGAMDGRALFLLDEVARLGYMRILETARDAFFLARLSVRPRR